MFTRWRLPRLRFRTSNCSLLLINLPRKDERLSRPGWLTYSGRFTHISGHPSAAGRAQDRETSPVKDQRSTAVPCVSEEDGWSACVDGKGSCGRRCSEGGRKGSHVRLPVISISHHDFEQDTHKPVSLCRQTVHRLEHIDFVTEERAMMLLKVGLAFHVCVRLNA